MKEKLENNLQIAKEKVEEIAESTGKGLKEGGKVAGEKIKIGTKFVGRKLKEGQVLAKDFTEERKLDIELRTLRPVFKDDLMLPTSIPDNADLLSKPKSYKMIFIVNKDKKRQDSLVCEGSIGHVDVVKGMRILNIYPDYVDGLGYSFFPHKTHTVYYADPYKEYSYISLDEYFDYFQKAQVNELETVAHKLGAKRVKISFKERKKTFVAAKADVNINGKGKLFGKKPNIQADFHHEHEADEYTNVEIAADVKFSGHETPTEPCLVYFKGVSDIEKLITMRMDNSSNKIMSKDYKFQCSKRSGISHQEAVQIDAALGALKSGGNASLTSEVEKEARTDLEYSIEF